MTAPEISVIIPVYNAGRYLHETIQSIQNQTFGNFEVIWVDGGSSDGSYEVLQRAAERDTRFVVVQHECSGAGAARNHGIAIAKGAYSIFLNSQDLFAPELLDKLYSAAVSSQADVTACNYCRLDAAGKEKKQTGIYINWIPGGLDVFSYRECPAYIIQVAGPMAWNKLYRSGFVRSRNFFFDELPACHELSFVAITQAAADKVTFVEDCLIKNRPTPERETFSLDDVHKAVESAQKQLELLPYYESIKNSVFKFVVEHYITALKKYVNDFSAPDAARFYQMVHLSFNTGDFAALKPEHLYNSERYREFCTVQKHDYETMKKLSGRRLVVSMTSYPRRIGAVAEVLEHIYAQSRKADEVVLWLAEEQFPNREEELPENLKCLIAQKKLTVRWCDDMKGHKKYFYALQEYAEDVVVTIDDDLLYPRDMLETLYKSYLLHPDAVSTLRAHLMIVNEQNRILSYDDWIHETDSCMFEPCMQLYATGGAGDLYPPHLFRKEFFDRDAVYDICLWADNLWVKAMELVSDVPVVLVRAFEPLRCVGGTQEETLYQINGGQSQYDIQMQKIVEWVDGIFGPDTLVKKLTQPEIGINIHGVKAVSHWLDRERKSNRWRKLTAERSVKEHELRISRITEELGRREKMLYAAETELSLTKDKLCGTQDHLRRTEERLALVQLRLEETEDKQKQTESKLKQTETQLKQTQHKLRLTEESKPIGRQLGELGALLRDQKAQGANPLRLGPKYVVYWLAWIPEKLLVFMMYCLKNGFAHTAKHTFRKLFRRGQ